MTNRPLTAKQQKYCEEYQIDLNATQAAIRAGYAANSINAFRVIGCTNLMKLNIKEEISRLKGVTSKKIDISVKWVVDNLKIVAERCMVKPYDNPGANKALQLIGMHVGAFEADNAQKAVETREYNIKELKVLIVEGEQRDKRILEAGAGIAE